MFNRPKKLITLVIGGRANWGRARTIAKEALADKNIVFDLILMGSALDVEFGSTERDVREDGFDNYFKIPTLTVGNNHTDQARATAQAIIGLCDYIENRSPDCIITVADRFETMATAISTSFSNIPLVHIQGGEISGNIDEKVRWAISMLSDIHFPSSEIAKKRLENIPQVSGPIHLCGCPSMDIVYNMSNDEIESRILDLNLGDEFVVVALHPNTEDINESEEIFYAIMKLIRLHRRLTFVIMKPNIDAGNLIIRNMIPQLQSENNVVISTGVSPQTYVALLKKSKLLIGNSSSLIREGGVIGKPAILLGKRQNGRDLEENVTCCDELNNLPLIFNREYGRQYSKSKKYGSGESGKNILINLLKELQ